MRRRFAHAQGVDAGIARLLIDAGAEVGALTRSWAQDVNAAYFAAGTKNKAMFDLLL